MKTLPLRLLVTAALLASATAASGQKKSAALDEVRALLASSAAAERARGAFLAARHRLPEASPDLLGVVRGYPRHAAEPGSAFAVEAALDALIQLGARVGGGGAGSELADLPPRFDHPVIVLLARNPALHQHGLLRTVDRPAEAGEPTHGAAVAAVLGLLLAQKTAGLASCAFKHLDPTVVVWVTRDGRKSSADAAADTRPPADPRRVPEGFPPIGFYRLVAGPDAKAKVAACGRWSIGYVRVVASAGEVVSFAPPKAPQPAAHDAAVEALAELLGGRHRSLLAQLPRKSTIPYRDDDQLERDLERIRNEAQSGYQAVLDQLREKRLLRADQAAALARKVRLDVHYPPRDRR